MITGTLPPHRVLVTRDPLREATGSGILLPSAYRVLSTGTVRKTSIEDINVGAHIAWDESIPSPEILVDGKFYLSIHEKDIILIKH